MRRISNVLSIIGIICIAAPGTSAQSTTLNQELLKDWVLFLTLTVRSVYSFCRDRLAAAGS